MSSQLDNIDVRRGTIAISRSPYRFDVYLYLHDRPEPGYGRKKWQRLLVSRETTDISTQSTGWIKPETELVY